jgi:hypothetical protein
MSADCQLSETILNQELNFSETLVWLNCKVSIKKLSIRMWHVWASLCEAVLSTLARLHYVYLMHIASQWTDCIHSSALVLITSSVKRVIIHCTLLTVSVYVASVGAISPLYKPFLQKPCDVFQSTFPAQSIDKNRMSCGCPIYITSSIKIGIASHVIFWCMALSCHLSCLLFLICSLLPPHTVWKSGQS